MLSKAISVILMVMSVLPLTLDCCFGASSVSVVEDLQGDWVTYDFGPGAPYSDILQAKIKLMRVPAKANEIEERIHMRVSMVLDGKVPSLPDESYLAYVWHFDLDGDGDFSDFPGDVNARVAWTGDGWYTYLDGAYFADTLFTFTITGSCVKFSFPLSYVNNPTSFSWFGLTYQTDVSGNLVATDPTSTATWSSS